MNTKTQIKVIKRDARPERVVAKKVKIRTTKETAREMVSTVTEWVNEFQQKRRVDAKEAFNLLFTDANGCTNC
jgi:uncharacterized membrane-anchored protein